MKAIFSKGLFILAVGFLAGVFAFSIRSFELIYLSFFSAFCFLALIINLKDKLVFLVSIFVIGFFIGSLNARFAIEKIYSREEADFFGKVKVLAKPERGLGKVSFDAVICEDEECGRILKDKIKVSNFSGGEVGFGDVLEIGCRLENPKNKDDKFNYARFLAKDNIFQLCRAERMKVVARGTGWRRAIFNFSDSVERKINKFFSYPESAYVAGLLLGGDDRMSRDLQEDFRRTGMTHAVAVSGSNITIVASIVLGVLIYLGFWRGQAFWLSILGVFIFVIMVGSPSSATRAGLMGGMVLWSSGRGRIVSSFRAIVWAASLMVFASPLTLVYDPGFQLSVLATIGITSVYLPLSEKLKFRNDFLGIYQILLSSLAAQLSVLGISAYQFGAISLIAPLANLILLPAMPIIMAGGLAAIGADFLPLMIGRLAMTPFWLLARLEIMVVEKFSSINGIILEFEEFSFWWLALYYAFFFGLIFWLNGSFVLILKKHLVAKELKNSLKIFNRKSAYED